MARNREGLVLLLDVGPSMQSLLPEVEKVCSMLVQKKVNYRIKSLFGFLWLIS
uniref:Uncharacterized protein n=1 Tax=Rhizophora mucronata TaxID=61149 RepID=A0A2P2KDX6_RHIMU